LARALSPGWKWSIWGKQGTAIFASTLGRLKEFKNQEIKGFLEKAKAPKANFGGFIRWFSRDL
jgi:hypothetical protein